MTHFKAMNTDFFTFGIDERAAANVKAWVQRVESRLSRFLPDSELTKLNHSNGNIFLGSDMLYSVVSLAHHFFTETEGVFNPFLGEILQQLGYQQSFERIDSPDIAWSELYQQATKKWQQPVTLNPIHKSISLDNGIMVDLGGMAKGWSVQKAKEWLMEEGKTAGVIDGGGDMAIWGEPADGPWCISVADPYEPEKDIAAFWTSRDVGIATSSTLKRKWSDSTGKVLHHILDPRTGEPSHSDLVQVTILAPEAIVAEVYAKCFIILGRTGWDWIHGKQPEIAYVAVTEAKELLFSPNIMEYCTRIE